MLYKISLITYYIYKNYFEAFLEAVSNGVSSFEYEDTTDIDPKDYDQWIVEAYFEEKPEGLAAKLEAYSKSQEFFVKDIKIQIVEEEDFATKVMMDFKPVVVSSFYIHNSVHQPSEKRELINLHIDSGMAFGTGDHETTSSCLEILSSIEVKDKTILDMGTGSGILSIAAAKLDAKKIVAVDIDEKSIETAGRNCHLNKVENKINLSVSDGYNSSFVENNGPYDIILSNILAAPLIEMAASLAENLKSGGFCILSGFLIRSSEDVIEAHKKQGLKLVEKKIKNNWVTVLMSK